MCLLVFGFQIAHASVLDMTLPDCAKLQNGVLDNEVGRYRTHTTCTNGVAATEYYVHNTLVSRSLFQTQLSLYVLKGDSCKEVGSVSRSVGKRTFTRECRAVDDTPLYRIGATASASYKEFMDTLEASGPTLDDMTTFLPEGNFSGAGDFPTTSTGVVAPPPVPIVSTACRINPATFAYLSRGAVGTNVTKVQLRLRTLGYFSGSANGHFGPITERAVKAYQKAKGIAQTGKVASKTLAALNASCPKT